MYQTTVRLSLRKPWGGLGNVGGMGRHYDPTKHMTLHEMKQKSVFYNDVYLDGLENNALLDRNYTRVLSPAWSKKLRWFRTSFLNFRLFNWVFWSSLLGFFLFYNITTFRYFGGGQRVQNFVKGTSESNRAAREAAAVENCEEYVPALLEGYSKLQAPANLAAWTNYEPRNEWKKIE